MGDLQRFDAEPAPWDLDEQSEQLVAEVVFSAAPCGPFDYAVPDALRASVALGKRVRVPLGRGDRLMTGYCVKLENRRVGIKSREVYEVPGALSLITAHQALEDLNLERDLGHFKPQLEQRFAELTYDGLWFSPLMEALQAFVDQSQVNVNGDVRLQYNSGTMMVVGRRSDLALYDEDLATYGDTDSFNHDDAEGFVRLWGLSLKTWAARQKPKG